MYHWKTKGLKTLSLLMTLAMLLSLLPTVALAAEDETAAAATFENVTDDGDDVVSLTVPRTFKVTIPVDGEVDPSAVTWTLTRSDHEYNDPDQYPNQLQGGSLDEWGIYRAEGHFFNEIETAYEDGAIVATLSNNCYFGDDPSAPHVNGGAYLDVCGYFDLAAEADGKTLGSIEIKIVPYDKFHLMSEIYESLDELVAYANENTDLYVEKFSMGHSSGVIYDALDMPYILIADSEQTVTDWLALTEKAETEPEQVLADIEAGKYDDIKVPVMHSNIHPNEVAATDGILDFAWTFIEAAAGSGKLVYNNLTGFTEEGQAEFEAELTSRETIIPDLVKDTATYLGWLTAGNSASGVVDLDKYYTQEEVTVDVHELLDDIFFILVPEENVEGRTYDTRTASNGYDLNRDNSFQTTNETQNMQKLIATFNPVSLTEFHGRVKAFQCEPCDPPHEPNFEYDLLAEHLIPGGETLGIAAVANNKSYNSYVIPQRDYLFGTSAEDAMWDAWDDMSTSYTPQFAMLQGTVAYTVELPAYSDDAALLVNYGILGQANYIASEKLGYLTSQTKIYERGVGNLNSDAYELVGQWLTDQADVEGAEMELFRPEYDGEGQNGNFYPECYIIPMDAENQTNLQAAADMMEWLSRNDVKISVAEKSFTYDGVTYPAGTMVVSMYQAKRSVANGALYNGTLIQSWTVLYSEGITAFNKTRGFDMAVCAEEGAYETIIAACGEAMDYDDCLDYIDGLTSSLEGSGQHVILSNASEASTNAVNELLKSGKKVGMVTDENSEFYGDFVIAKSDWNTVAKKYLLTGTALQTADVPAAQVISKAPSVFITGASADNDSGFVYTSRVGNANWNYDRTAMSLLGFDTTDDASKADVILGASRLSGDALTAVQAGTPFIGYGSNGSQAGSIFGEQLVRASIRGAMDCLGYVTYPTTTLVNASYVNDGDDILYGYGAGYFTAVPEGAEILVQMDSSKTPLEGFLPTISDAQKSGVEGYIGSDSIQGIAYEGADASGNEVNVVLFANSLTHKAHQRDEYAFISNFIYSNLLDGEYLTQTPEQPVDDTPVSGGTSVSGSGSSNDSIKNDNKNSSTAAPVVSSQPETVNSFNDVLSGDWFAAAVKYVNDNGMMNGVSDHTFDPSGTLSRAMVVAILYRLDGDKVYHETSPFADVAIDSWYGQAVAWAAEKGVVNGVSETSFAPETPVTREQLAAILYRYAAYKKYDTVVLGGNGLANFTDASAVSDWAADAMVWANAKQLITGRTATTLAPAGTATRAEAAAIFARFDQNIAH